LLGKALEITIFVEKLKDMVAEARTSRLAKPKPLKFTQPKLLTFEDYARLTPSNSGNYELHNGRIIHTPSPLIPHHRLSRRLVRLIENYLFDNPIGELFYAPMDVIFNPNDTMQPDILVVSNERASIKDRQIKGAPDFIVEILSDGNTTKEMSYKKYVFETHGVREYWLVNLAKQTITQYENFEDEFIIRNKIKIDGSLTSFVIEGFTLKASDIFE
jgi:Uma2 family endonuclease